MIANDLGLIPFDEIINLADKEISELTKPDYWLIELSAEKRKEAIPLISNDTVIRKVLSVAYSKLLDDTISQKQFKNVIRNMYTLSDSHGELYATLSWADDDYSLIEQGVFRREDRLDGIYKEIEKLIG